MVDKNSGLAAASHPDEPVVHQSPTLGVVLDPRPTESRDVVEEKNIPVPKGLLDTITGVRSRVGQIGDAKVPIRVYVGHDGEIFSRAGNSDLPVRSVDRRKPLAQFVGVHFAIHIEDAGGAWRLPAKKRPAD